jgi:hypothetical protein
MFAYSTILNHFCFWLKINTNIPLVLGWTMTSLINLQQINFVACFWSLEFFAIMSFSSVFSFTLDSSTWSLFFCLQHFGLLVFCSRFLSSYIWKVTTKQKDNTTISNIIEFHIMFIIDIQIMWTHATTTYLSSTYIWEYRPLLIIALSK